MDEIRTLIKISRYYRYGSIYSFDFLIVDEGVEYYAFQNDKYDEHYRICYEAARNFINTSEFFSELNPEEIIKGFADIKFKNNTILLNSLWDIFFYNLENLFEKLLRVNKEMLVALIKAINDNKIKHKRAHYFIDDNGDLGARRGIEDDEMIRLYRILLGYNNFSLDNLNIKNIINDIRPSMTKRAI